MPRARRLAGNPNEFSEFVFPDPHAKLWDGLPAHLQHRLICCDCGLAHDFEFVVVKLAKGRFSAVAPKNYAIQFRVRRNERSTAQIRKADALRVAQGGRRS